jgi:hypothetical protein
MRRIALIVLLAVATSVSGQRSIPAGSHFGPPSSATHFGSASRFGAFSGFNRGYGYRSFYSPLLSWDPFYTDALYNSGYPVASQSPVVVLQGPPGSDSVPNQPPAQPLIIELRGDRYVRVSSAEISEDSGAQVVEAVPSSPHQTNQPSVASNNVSAAPESPPATLVFRDGHREEVSDYTIAGGILYTSSNYYTDGAWNRRIEISSLNLPETINSNRSRGVPFRLPAAPNEVIVGP